MAQILLRQAKRTASSALIKSGLHRVLYPRNFHAYCCGTGRSGTHSIRATFQNYRAAHEPEMDRSLALAIKFLEGKAQASEIEKTLKDRDRRLWLEMDSSNLNQIFLRQLVKFFPSAKFLLTIRDLYSWSDSMFNDALNKNYTPMWAQITRIRMKPVHFPHTENDQPLEERGLYSLPSYFNYWNEHNASVLDIVPSDRLLVVRTQEIVSRTAEMAKFFGIPSENLKVEEGQRFAAPQKFGVLAELDPDYVRNTAEKFGGELMQRFFPDVTSGSVGD